MADRTKRIMDSGAVWVIALGMSRSQLCRGSLLPLRGHLLRDGVVTPPRVGRLAFGGPDVPSPGNEAMAGGGRAEKTEFPSPRGFSRRCGRRRQRRARQRRSVHFGGRTGGRCRPLPGRKLPYGLLMSVGFSLRNLHTKIF